MQVFNIKTVEHEIRAYYYQVEAENLEEAKEKVRGGEGEMVDSKFIEGEIERVEEEKD